MNMLENYIKEVHSVEPYTEEWVKKFPNDTFVKVDLTIDCYGSIERKERVLTTKEWERDQERGYYMA